MDQSKQGQGNGNATKIAVDVRTRQEPLREHYRQTPSAARITDQARTTGGVTSDPFHGTVEPGGDPYGIAWTFGIHRAVGGFHDAPNPGDMLCAALAACLDSTIRIIANRLAVILKALEVEVTADVDVRGTLAVARDVPVGFQAMRCHVRIQVAAGANPTLVKKLLGAAEQSCINLQTLRAGVPVETTFDIGGLAER